jgi:rubredoxin
MLFNINSLIDSATFFYWLMQTLAELQTKIDELIAAGTGATAEDLEEIKSWHCPTCGGGKHETHDPIDRLIAEYMTPAPQAQAKLDEKTIKAQMLAWFRAEPSEYAAAVYLPSN